MYAFALIVTEIVAVLNALFVLIDPTTFVGGLVALSLVGGVGMALLGGVIALVRR
jgi:hypothetical protein